MLKRRSYILLMLALAGLYGSGLLRALHIQTAHRHGSVSCCCHRAPVAAGGHDHGEAHSCVAEGHISCYSWSSDDRPGGPDSAHCPICQMLVGLSGITAIADSGGCFTLVALDRFPALESFALSRDFISLLAARAPPAFC